MSSTACSRVAFASSWAQSNHLAKVSAASTVDVLMGSTPRQGCWPAVSVYTVELGAQTALHLSVSKGVIQRKRESQSSATSSSNDNSRPGPMAQAVHTGMKYVLFT